MRREALSLGALVAVLAGRGGAQVVRGTVSAAGVRVPGAIVLLVDAEGRTVARAAARDDGTYSVAAPATGERGGRYTLRVLRIGFTPTVVGPIALPRGAVTTRDVSLTGAPVRLAEVRVSDRARCRARPESDTTALRLLEEARKALLGETLTRAEPLRMRITTAERELDAAGGRTVSEKADTRLVSGVRPFATNVPPESLAVAGYVTRDVDGRWLYRAPDADVLLSESFATSHCFRVELPPPDSARLARWVGIGFVPARPRAGVADVEGVLWLDRASAELREFDFRYANLPDEAQIASHAARAGAGGRVEFLRLPNGGWIVHRWQIRMPIVGARVGAGVARRGAAIVPGVAVASASATELVGVQLAGGDVSEVRRAVGARADGADSVLWERGRNALRVRLVDSERAEPVPNAVVELDDGAVSAGTGPDGVATLLRVLPGPHRLQAHTPVHDFLGAAPAPRSVRVGDESDAEPLVITVPSDRAALAGVCGAHVAEWDEALLRGTVAPAPNGTTVGGTPIGGAPVRVEATWPVSYVRLGGGAPVVATDRREATADARGEYTLCGVPREVDVTVRALRGAAAGPAVSVRVPARSVGRAVDVRAP